MRKKRILRSIAILIIVWIWISFSKKTTPSQSSEEKIDFVIETMSLGDQSAKTAITKNGKVEWISDITLSAQTAGRVVAIDRKIGDNIAKNSLIIELEDSQWSSRFRAENSAIAVETAENTYEVQKKNLEKQIQDLLLAKERVESN